MSIAIRKLDAAQPDFQAQLTAVLAFEAGEDEAIDQAAARILADVKARGDAAVLEYTSRFDRLSASSVTTLEIGQQELQDALAQLSPERRSALQTAADRVRAYHERQKAECGSDGFSYTEADGTVLGQKVTPLDRVGIYVPGGKAAYPSSVLMNAIPAKVAGVQEIIMVVPTPDGIKNPLVLAAAAIAGVDRVFTIGGAQAVAALAYGTASFPRSTNCRSCAYVAAAKRRVRHGRHRHDQPSEIWCCATAPPIPTGSQWTCFRKPSTMNWRSRSCCVLTRLYRRVSQHQPPAAADAAPRSDPHFAHQPRRAQSAREGHACEIAGHIAAEHLEISAENPQRADWIPPRRRHVPGPVFVGSAGRLPRRTNHVLPTSRTAFLVAAAYDL